VAAALPHPVRLAASKKLPHHNYKQENELIELVDSYAKHSGNAQEY
jgi:hypothetical protein